MGFIAKDLAHRADQGIGVAGSERKQQLCQPPIRLDAAEYLLVLYLAGHDRLGYACVLKRLDQLGQFPQRKPVHRSRTVLLDLSRRLLLDRRHHDLHALRARSIQHQQGKLAVARNQSDLFRKIRHVSVLQLPVPT
jgi:hypothetical protein